MQASNQQSVGGQGTDPSKNEWKSHQATMTRSPQCPWTARTYVASHGHPLAWFKQTRAAVHQKSLLFVNSFSRKPLHKPGNKTATPSYLLEVRSAFRADFHPGPSALQWTRNSFAVAAGWIGLSNGQQYQAFQIWSPTSCNLPTYSGAQRHHIENLNCKTFHVCAAISEKKCGTNARSYPPVQLVLKNLRIQVHSCWATAC